MNYKLIKYELDGREWCNTPCPYNIKGVYSFNSFQVGSNACRRCTHFKGSTSKHVKCSYDYDMQQPSEIKTGKVTSSDCVQVADEKPKAEKVKKYKYVCDTCQHPCKLVVEELIKPKYCPYTHDTTAKWKLKGEA
jgi:hypothetical protein